MKLLTILIIAVVLMGLFSTAAITQYYSDYSGRQAIVIVNKATVYSLPSLQNAHKIATLNGGSKVDILEKRINWYYIRNAECEGWVKVRDVASTAPASKMFPLPWQQKTAKAVKMK